MIVQVVTCFGLCGCNLRRFLMCPCKLVISLCHRERSVINMRSVDLLLYINKLTAKKLASAIDVQYSLFLSNATSYFSNILEAPVPVLDMNLR